MMPVIIPAVATEANRDARTRVVGTIPGIVPIIIVIVAARRGVNDNATVSMVMTIVAIVGLR